MHNDSVKTVEFKGKRIDIYQDENPENPREWDNLGTMVCFHKRHDLGDKHDYDCDNYVSWDEFQEAIIKKEDVLIILPLYLFDHSGITISTSSERFRACDNMGWDWGQVGFIFVSKEKARKDMMVKRLTKATLKKVEAILQSEVKAYDDYLTGAVYGYIITDENNDELFSYWGYYLGEDETLDNCCMLDKAKKEIENLEKKDAGKTEEVH